jgi:RNA polymerase sigma factor (sigma-70 family)
VSLEARDTGGAALADRPTWSAGATDHQLVSAARRGDDRAFEQLYVRYERRITAYVRGMVKDHGRAEDVTQEVFVSALRRMRQTERPIAFKPWIYGIARNACIDAYRRGSRAEEVSYDAEDALSPSDHGRLIATDPQPDAAVDAKQDLDHLCGAFGGLSDSHHEVLVMRELEGRSYEEIGERTGMSRPAVESTLFRARKRLGEEYDELASGTRCLRIQSVIAGSEHTPLGKRDQRRVARHVAHCERCKQLALRARLDLPVPVRRRAAGKIAAWLPFPAFLRARRGDADGTAGRGGAGGAWASHAPGLADAMSSGWSKAVAGLAALLLAGAGSGVTTHGAGDQRDERGTGDRATGAATARAAATAPRARLRASADRRAAPPARSKPVRRHGGGSAAPSSGPGERGASDGPAQGPARNGAGAPASATPADSAPEADAPVDAPDQEKTAGDAGGPLPGVRDTVDEVTAPVDRVTAPVDQVSAPVDRVTAPVDRVTAPVEGVTAPLPDVGATAGDAVQDVQSGAQQPAQVVPQVTDAAGDAVEPVTDTTDGLLNP